MANSPKRPVVARQNLPRLQQESERLARGPKDIEGATQQWRLDESGGHLGVRVQQRGRNADALFDPTRGEWFT